MEATNLLLESHLKTLRLATFREQYRQVAEDAAGHNLGYEQYLLALAEQEVTQRELNRQRQRIKAARFPVLKELADEQIPTTIQVKVEFLKGVLKDNVLAGPVAPDQGDRTRVIGVSHIPQH